MEMVMNTKTTLSTVPEAKDVRRIADIVTKAGGDTDKAIRLARTMAKAITSPDKAMRRSLAAREAGYQDIEDVFLVRFKELAGSVSKPENFKIRLSGVKFVKKEKFDAKPRVYFWDKSSGQTGIDMFLQRWTPRQVFTPVLEEVLNPIGFTNHVVTKPGTRLVKATWSQYAGCSCPCSPGFILDMRSYEYDLHVSYTVVRS